MKHVVPVVLCAQLVTLTACEVPTAGEGDPCSAAFCAPGLVCVPGVGAEHGLAETEAVCEPPGALYAFVHFGERGENSRVDEAIAMIGGRYRMPRMLDSDPDLATVPYRMTTADGKPVRCRDVAAKPGPERDCLVPDWPAYYGLELAKYPRFILFGLRMVGALVYTQHYAEDKRLRDRIALATGRAPSQVSREELGRVRQDAGRTALAILDSFVAAGHVPFALREMPSCYTGSGGYQNPNAAWAPELAAWDPATAISPSGRLVTASDVPIDCSGRLPFTYAEVRNSVWDRHASAFRALALTNGYRLFRGLLPEARRRAWLTVLRETGDALALPSSYEAGDNHGITESAALIVLGHDFADVDPAIMPREVTRAWLTLGRYRLNDLFVDTIFPDGVQVEQSPFYHNYQLVLLLQIVDWMRARGLDLVTGIDPSRRLDWDALAPAPADPNVNGLNPSPTLDAEGLLDKMVRASIHLGQPDGFIPMIGSSLPQRIRDYGEGVLDVYARRDTDLARQLLFYRTGGAEGVAPPHEDRLMVFGDSGFVTLHGGFEPRFPTRTHLVFNAGLPYHGHSHPDALAVHLFGPDTTPGAEAGVPLLVDSGWFSYLDDRRHYFESTLAHNTVNVNAQNQCVRDAAGKRAAPYAEAALDTCQSLRTNGKGAMIGRVARGLTARDDGAPLPWAYQSAQHGLYRGVTHRRGVALLGDEVVVVVDQLEADEPSTFSQTWHLTPRVPKLPEAPTAQAGTWHLAFPRAADDPTPLFSLHQPDGDGALELALHHGEPAIGGIPGQGWYSDTEGVLTPNTVVEVRRVHATKAAFASVFLLGERAAERPRVTLERQGARLVVEIRFEDRPPITLDVRDLAEGAPREAVSID